MNARQREDLCLWLLRDAAAPSMWLDRWAVSYPLVAQQSVAVAGGIDLWQRQCAAVWADIRSEAVMVVAHGCAALAWLAWLYQSDISSQRRLQAVMLVSPEQSAWQDDAAHSLWRARSPCPTALVIGHNDPRCPQAWAAEQAQRWGARLLQAPQSGHLDAPLQGWQWGMRLMQEILDSTH